MCQLCACTGPQGVQGQIAEMLRSLASKASLACCKFIDLLQLGFTTSEVQCWIRRPWRARNRTNAGDVAHRMPRMMQHAQSSPAGFMFGGIVCMRMLGLDVFYEQGAMDDILAPLREKVREGSPQAVALASLHGDVWPCLAETSRCFCAATP